jgi:hypothetical protein
VASLVGIGAADVGAAMVGVMAASRVSSACDAVASEKVSDASIALRTKAGRRRLALLRIGKPSSALFPCIVSLPDRDVSTLPGLV